MGEIIKNRIVVTDAWRHVADDHDVEANVIVGLERWLAEPELQDRTDIGVSVASEQGFEPLLAHLESLPVIALDFPRFADGRSYSKARLLRVRYGYTGELRATGDIQRDQLFYLRRCGFDAFEVVEGDIRQALLGLSDFSVAYQAAADGRLPVYLQDQAGAPSESEPKPSVDAAVVG